MPQTADWEELIKTFLHDPPDKAVDIKGHERRAASYATVALGREVTKDELHRDSRSGDIVSSAIERLPMPTAGPQYVRAVGPEGGKLTVVHPLSAETQVLAVENFARHEPSVRDIIANLVAGEDNLRNRFFALWRLLPERLGSLDPAFDLLPADTRVPDHTIWNHLDLAVAFEAAQRGGATSAALLAFGIGPVQSFIAAARSARDLWTGSYILSHVCFAAMKPIIEHLGPQAILMPSLRGNPRLDLALIQTYGLNLQTPDDNALLAPCLPNRFTALVPAEDLEAYRVLCCEAARTAWQEIANEVHDVLNQRWQDLSDTWSHGWQQQVHDTWTMHTAGLPLLRGSDEAQDAQLRQLLGNALADDLWKHYRALARAIPEPDRPGYVRPGTGGRWSGRTTLISRLLDSQRMFPNLPSAGSAEDGRPKCAVFRGWSQMGPIATTREHTAFWEDAAAHPIGSDYVRRREGLSAPALIKRFAWHTCLSQILGLSRRNRAIPDTATIAAADWLEAARLDSGSWQSWNGYWLHLGSDASPADEECEGPPEDCLREIRHAAQRHGPPPKYYAALMLDGDHMGKWLRGDKAPSIGTVLAPTIKTYFENGTDPSVLGRGRPVTPALHAAISRGLGAFATRHVPAVVAQHKGTLIYAGGDDVLALLPLGQVLGALHDLRNAFQSNDVLGSKATISASIVIAHYKDNLRHVIEQARAGEQRAKDSDRDAVAMVALRRSGEHATAVCRFGPALDCWQELYGQFASSADDGEHSTRWTYALRADLDVFKTLPPEALRNELVRLLEKSQAHTDLKAAALRFYDAYTDSAREREWPDFHDALVTLYQSAVFMARNVYRVRS